MQPGIVRLHIRANDPQLQLHRFVGSAMTGYIGGPTGGLPVFSTISELICRVPCDQIIDGRKGEEFFFDGKGITTSASFQIFDKSGDIDVVVQPGNQVQKTMGQIFTWTGLPVAAFGGLFLALSINNTNQYAPDGSYPSSSLYEDWKSAKTTSGIILGTGLVFIAGGIAMWATSGTSYEFQPSGAAPIAPSQK
jgi:hypothetical protein